MGPEPQSVEWLLAHGGAADVPAHPHADGGLSMDRIRAAALDALPHGVVVVSPDGALLFHNARFRALWGLDEATVAAGDAASLEGARSLVADPEGFMARVRELYASPGLESLDDIEFADGRIIERHGGPVCGEGGGHLGQIWTFRDVTEQRRRRQAEVRQAQMRLELLERLEHTSRALDRALTPSQVLLAILREGLAALGADAGYVALLADDRSHMQVRKVDAGTELVEYLGDVPTDAALPIAEAVRTGGALYIGNNEDLRCEHPRLKRLMEDDHACVTLPLLGEGRVRAVLNIGYATPRRFDARDRELFALLADRASVALDRALLYHSLEEQAHSSYALAYVADAVFMVDERGMVRAWNPAASEILGVPAEDAEGSHVADVVPGWDELAERIPIHEPDSAVAGRPVNVPIQGRRGEQTTISVSGVRGPTGTVYAFRDVTEEERLERAKSDFVATVSHEMRTPLTSIMGGALTLQRSDLGLDDATREALLDLIVAESRRLATITEQVLLAGQLDAGNMQHERIPLDLSELVHSSVAALEQRVPDAVVETVGFEQPERVTADPDRLRQVVDNLLDNAVKYSPESPRVWISATREAGRLALHVRDEGLGIPASEQQRVFEKFYRTDPSMSRGVGGAGLGLHIARELMRGMGGDLTLHSKGTGSTFSAWLPEG